MDKQTAEQLEAKDGEIKRLLKVQSDELKRLREAKDAEVRRLSEQLSELRQERDRLLARFLDQGDER